jgi:hypothetical protein
MLRESWKIIREKLLLIKYAEDEVFMKSYYIVFRKISMEPHAKFYFLYELPQRERKNLKYNYFFVNRI